MAAGAAFFAGGGGGAGPFPLPLPLGPFPLAAGFGGGGAGVEGLDGCAAGCVGCGVGGVGIAGGGATAATGAWLGLVFMAGPELGASKGSGARVAFGARDARFGAGGAGRAGFGAAVTLMDARPSSGGGASHTGRAVSECCSPSRQTRCATCPRSGKTSGRSKVTSAAGRGLKRRSSCSRNGSSSSKSRSASGWTDSLTISARLPW